MLDPSDRQFLQTLAELVYCNPFEPRRIELEQLALGDDFGPEPFDSWSRTEANDRHDRPNVVRINQRAERLVESIADRLHRGEALDEATARRFEEAVTYALYYRHVAPMPIDDAAAHRAAWRRLRDDRERLLTRLPSAAREGAAPTTHLFACLFQVRRAFTHIFACLIGASRPATRLRAAVWQSIFTHDLRRYRRTLFDRMGELSTLVTGPSGAGKELVAQAIGRAQYWPFDEQAEAFPAVRQADEAVAALNLSAMSPTLIESELFGHKRGAFTGATGDRVGWLERCPPHGAVFLDEIGELDPTIQVKLLRVAQSRDFSRLGETEPRRFVGKLVAATNRDLAREMQEGRFREDLYYRLCSDRVHVPSLREQLAEQPDAIDGLVQFLSRRVLGEAPDAEVEALAGEVTAWIERALPEGYAWPGNIRELEQCVRGVLVRREYRPSMTPGAATDGWLAKAERGELTADELLNAYCAQVYRQAGGYEPAARRLGIDRRTVKSRRLAAEGEPTAE